MNRKQILVTALPVESEKPALSTCKRGMACIFKLPQIHQ